MSELHHNWKRFWIPANESTLSLADAGFLPDPDGEFGNAFNPDVVEFSEIESRRCLVLIGEPGIGKTHAVDDAANELRDQLAEEGDEVLNIDLGSTRSETILRRKVFESDEFVRWRDGSHQLHLFLDSLDEARLRLEIVRDVVLDGLADADPARLFLRIACRSADRHYGLEAGLQRVLGEDEFAVFELVPLRRADVQQAAMDYGLDGETFEREVIARDLQPLAMKPITLRLLATLVSETGAFPHSKREAYEKGCMSLCEEPDEDRRSGHASDQSSASEKLEVAARVAAATMLSGRSSIWIGGESGEISSDDARLTDLAGGTELDTSVGAPTAFDVSQQVVRETLSSGLFSARGDQRVGWVHQTFGEFLAARYLAQERIALDQIRDLLTISDSSVTVIVPQLREVAAWLAPIRRDFFEMLRDTDPGALLTSDLASIPDDEKLRLYELLLCEVAEQRIDMWDSGIRANFKHFEHPGLEQALRTSITNADLNDRARETAIRIAEACSVDQLAGDFARIALDISESAHVRTTALYAIGDFADDSIRRQISGLATDALAADRDDEIKGAALRATYPRVLSTVQLFRSLTTPKVTSLVGTYSHFLGSQVIPNLKNEDLPVALQWAGTVPRGRDSLDALARLSDEILEIGLSHMNVGEAADAVADVVAARLKTESEIFDSYEKSDDSKFKEPATRNAVLTRLIPAISRGEIHPANVLFSRPPLLQIADLDWTIEGLLQSLDTDQEKGWAMLVEGLMSRGAAVEKILDARERSSELRQATVSWFDPVRLDSEAATQSRESHKKWSDMMAEEEEEGAEMPDMSARVRSRLAAFEGGELDSWWTLNLDLSVKQGARFGLSELDSDLMSFPGWEAASSETRSRILGAAKRYLLEGAPDPDSWIGTNIIHRPAFAGYRALRLVWQQEAAWIERHAVEVFERWASIVVSWPRSGTEEEGQFHDQAMSLAYIHAPAQTVEWFARDVQTRLTSGSTLLLVDRFKTLNIEDFEGAIAPLLEGREGTIEARSELIDFLLKHGSVHGRTIAKQAVTQYVSTPTEQDRAFAVACGTSLIRRSPDAGWDVIWPAVTSDPDFGSSVFEEIAHRSDTPIWNSLNEAELADLFGWLERAYPTAEDPSFTEMHFVGTRENVGQWRNAIVRGLIAKGTRESVEATRFLANEFPELDYLNRLVNEARDVFHRETWEPPSPALVVQLGADANRRYVNTAAELHDLVSQSLRRFQGRLQGATPTAADLWNTRGEMTPKSEPEISDRIKQWLEDDLRGRGVVVGREVQIRLTPGSTMGESPDIWVDAVAGEHVEGAAVVSVIVEVKGCWNQHLNSAMETQLADRYLNEDSLTHGIYLVAWFGSEPWSDSDYRRARCARSRADMEAALQAQAVVISRERSRFVSVTLLDASLAPTTGPAAAEHTVPAVPDGPAPRS